MPTLWGVDTKFLMIEITENISVFKILIGFIFSIYFNLFIFNHLKFIQEIGQRTRVVKELVLKTSGLCPRRFAPKVPATVVFIN